MSYELGMARRVGTVHVVNHQQLYPLTSLFFFALGESCATSTYYAMYFSTCMKAGWVFQRYNMLQ